MDLYNHYMDTSFTWAKQIKKKTNITEYVKTKELTNFHALTQDQVDKQDFNFVRIPEVNETIEEQIHPREQETFNNDSTRRLLDENMNWNTMPQEILD